MKVAVYYSNDDVRIENRPKPRISDGEILVKMKASGICGTDVMQWYRMQKAPCILGHEMSGEIEAAGKKVKGFQKGDRVFVSHHVPCFECSYCVQNKYTACETLHTGNYIPGGFAEFIRVPEDNVKHGTFLLPDKMSFEDATMIEPLGCVIAGQRELGLKRGKTALIIGSGVSGILHIQMAKTKGVKVIATDINEYRLRKAIEFGADCVIQADIYSADDMKSINNDRLADTVIVCAAAEKAVEDALSSVDRKGKILFFAVPRTHIMLPSLRFWRDEMTVTFSYGAAPCDIQEAIKLIKRKKVDVRGMITHRIPFSDIQRGFRLASEAKESLKVIVVPDKEL